jgi:lipopolysaccharide/colanic/teichoic acid biosynthesis glycosyltransferase
MLLSALAIRLTSAGPVLFRQERVGLNGRRFSLYKFRTMIVDAERQRDALLSLNEMDGPVFKISRDPRVTPVGAFLRRSSLDELPQLFNVLWGQMSLVGPRPPIPSEVRQYEAWQRRRLSMKPGITCLWQVNGRNKIGFRQWMAMDLEYIDKWSLGLDLKILAQTIPAVLKREGAK